MDLTEFQNAINEGNFEKFKNLLKDVPIGEYPEIKIMPKFGSVTDSEENVEIFLGLKELGYDTIQALEASKKYSTIGEAVCALKNS